ncbi:MAG: hypothetical protein LBL50_01910 [Candidatus Margulisbacteria bacterium]|jgi:transcriptional regulator with XRE-family HTH domain|nr:hypothetical protein [Candidatus Margulisiibacteriota bacterium]
MDKAAIEKELKLLISGKLQLIKKQSGASLEKMAEEVGLEYASFYNIYKGLNLPRLVTLFQISRRYHLPVEFWFKKAEALAGREEAGLRRKPAESELVQLFNELDPGAKKVLKKMLKGYLRQRRA